MTDETLQKVLDELAKYAPVREIALGAAGTLPVWRDTVAVILAGIIIGALWLYATLMGIE